MPHPSLAAIFVAGAVLLAAASPALAQGGGPGVGASRRAPLDARRRAEAKAHFDRGADLYAQGAYEEALTEWQRSHEISQHPLIFESIANAYERLGRPREAREALAKWREAAPPEEHALLDRRLENLAARAKKLDDDAAAAKARAAAVAAPPPASTTEEEVVEESEGSPLVPIGFVVGGVGLGMVVAGLVVGGVAAGERPDEATACREGEGGSLCLGPQRDAIESSATLALVSDILWIGGAAATATGVVLVVIGMSEEAGEAEEAPAEASIGGVRARLDPIVGPSLAGATVRGSW